MRPGSLRPDFKFGDYPAEFAPGKFLFASPQTMGDYAPLGVQCDLPSLLNGSCTLRLRRFFRETGGSYDAD